MISVVIPHRPGLQGVEDALKRCIASFENRADEIIVVPNEISYAYGVNRGLDLASGEWIIVANNDTELTSGDIHDLCIDHRVVTIPKLTPEPRDKKPRSFFCASTWVWTMVDNMDEGYEVGYFEDDDWIKRLEERQIETRVVESVHVSHLEGGGLTMKQMGEAEYFNKNRERYERKWNV